MSIINGIKQIYDAVHWTRTVRVTFMITPVILLVYPQAETLEDQRERNHTHLQNISATPALYTPFINT